MTTPRLALAAMLSALMLGGPAAIAATHAPPPDLASQQAVIDAPIKLLMVERRGCIYCEAWHNEVMPEYAKTPEGKAAPLLRVQVDGPWPDGLALDRKPYITPTFILIENGKEVSRLEGYPGEMYFWPMLDNMLKKAGIPLAPAGG